ncbi:hypothetical protein PJL18_04423 [Paenarthrobacter nicotinovorans]|nr:hypothetical protein [Paenarthrobacter nicotinovorans]
MDGIAEGVEDGAELRGNGFVMVDPDVRLRDHDIFGERAIALDAHGDRVDAHLAASGAAVAADSADYVPFAGDAVADLDVADVLADFNYFTVELVACDQGGFDDALRPGVPALDVEVRAADSGGHHADLDVACARFRFRTVDEFETGVGSGFVESLHGIPHCWGCFTAAESIEAPATI